MLSHSLEQEILALSMREDGITPHQTHDSKAHASSWYTMFLSGVKAYISEVEAISDIK